MEASVSRPQRRIFTVPSWPHPYPSPRAWRHLIVHAAENGLDEFHVLIRSGRRLIIDEDRFFKWLDDRNAAARQEIKVAAGRQGA